MVDIEYYFYISANGHLYFFLPSQKEEYPDFAKSNSGMCMSHFELKHGKQVNINHEMNKFELDCIESMSTEQQASNENESLVVKVVENVSITELVSLMRVEDAITSISSMREQLVHEIMLE